MFCSSCGKKITENSKFCKYCGSSQVETEVKEKKKVYKNNYKVVWTCDYCGEEFKTKAESDAHELFCVKNPKRRKKFFKNNSQRAWFYLWVVTLLVFIVSLLINTKFDEYGIDLFHSDFLNRLFFFNILVGINAFLAMVVTSIKKNNKESFLTSNILIISLAYFFINTSVFAVEGFKAKNDEGYKNKYYVEITPTPMPTVEPTVTPKVIPKKTVNPIQKVVDTDPIVDCVSSSPNCNGSSIKLRRSQCPNITCCQIGNNWSVYPSSEKCKEAQNSAKPQTVNSPQIVPSTGVYNPNANKSPVFLSYSGNTIYCPTQNVDAVKSINSTMESKKSEWASKYNECTSNFYTTNSCCVSCKQTFDSGWASCDKSNECLNGLSEEYKDCLRKCPSATDYCQYVYDEQKSLSSQITNLCK